MGRPGRTAPAYRRQLDPTEVAVECWCRATTVGVPRAEVLAGLTRSCGASACDNFDRQHRQEAP